MCGRFTLHLADLSKLVEQLAIRRMLIADWKPHYNLAPTQLAPVALRRERSDERVLELMRFGLVPGYARKEAAEEGKPRGMLVNARVETVGKLGAFRKAFERRRCIVPATGFYEWMPLPGGKRRKQPMWIHPARGDLLAFAGIYEPMIDEHGEVVDTFAIVTTEATPQLHDIHDRMPLVLDRRGVERWLEGGRLPEDVLRALVAAVPEIALEVRPVSTLVSSPQNDEPRCIEPVPEPNGDDGDDDGGDRGGDPGDGQLELF